MIFVFAYDRPEQMLIGYEEFADSDSERAENHRRSLETQHSGNDAVEVVLLRSQDRSSLERTHSRYFRSTEQIENDLKSRVG
ncbi:MAG: hypothetical protein ABR975_11395 [Vulcanimicrobiaceae bacterium]|jgi:hypothetical protein